MTKWLILFLVIPWCARATKTSEAGRERLCENLLQTEKADVQLPLQPELLEKILLHFYDLKLFDQKPLESTALEFQKTEGPMREYLREILNSLEGHRALSVRALMSHFLKQEQLLPTVELTQKRRFRDGEVHEIQSFFHNEITKLPLHFQELLQRQNRRFRLVANPRTLEVKVQRFRAVFGRNWREPWEREQTSMLMEVLKNLDEACRDESGQALSRAQDFLSLWRDTELRPEERHLRFFPQAAFAEWGSWYYDSVQSREKLNDLYPRIALYFSHLTECP